MDEIDFIQPKKTVGKLISVDVLDKIKAEIEALNPVDYVSISSYEGHKGASDMKNDVLQIIDKYKEEKMQFVKGKLPQKSGNYIVRYKGKIGRDDFTTNGNHWWNTGTKNDQLDVEWVEESFKELGL